MEAGDNMYLFVYGTLMNGRSNHRFLAESKYIGKAVLKGYGMYGVSSFPGIIKKSGSIVIGEVYEIDRDTLKKVDMLEGEGVLYTREVADVCIEDQELAKAFIYVWYGKVNEDTAIPLKNQPWNEK